MSAESKGKWGALAAALVLLLGGGTGGFFLGKAQTLKQQQQVIDVQDCTTIYATISQISGGSRTSVGGYDIPETPDDNSAQFDVSDRRSLDEVVRWLMEMDYIPSFCTACYRAGRTGDRFMALCKSGQIQNCCHPNALITLQEFLTDYASPETRALGQEVLKRQLLEIPNENVRAKTETYLREILQGARDFRF